jgi:hypothetical protein
VNAPVFQPPGGQPTRTGTCPECGRENLAMTGRAIEEHTQIRMRRGGVYDSGQHCDGTGGPPEPGSVSNLWSTANPAARPHRGNAMPTKRRQHIQRRDGAA